MKPILLVEDTHNVRDFLEVTLKFKGFPVISVQNGEEALEKISEEHPSLIITDILMPKLDGFALVQKLRTDPETCSIPIIFISATYVPLKTATSLMNWVSRALSRSPLILRTFC